MKTLTQTKFWQSSIGLSLVVIWLGLAGLFDLLQFLKILSWDGIGFLLFCIVNFSLAIGLINKRAISRLFTILWVGLASLMRIAVLIILDSEFAPGPHGLNLGFVNFSLSRYQMIALLILNIAINFGVIYVLLKPSIKVIFLPRSTKPETL